MKEVKSIPILTGDSAKAFVKKADDNLLKKGTITSPINKENYFKIIAKSKLK